MLRYYQIEAINSVEQSIDKNVCLQMPTGSGKTFTFVQIAKNYSFFEQKRVLILVHRTELLKQTKESLGDEKCFLIQKGVKAIPSNFEYYIGMVETVNRRLDKLPEIGLVIIDECHIGNFSKLPFFTNENIKVLGVTATPYATKPLKNYYQKLIQPVTIGDLIEQKYLCESKVYAFGSDETKKQNFKVTKGEYDEGQLEEYYSSEKMVKNVVEAYWSHSAGKKTMIFNVNIQHSLTVYSALLREGLNVYHVDGFTPEKQRAEIITKFKEQSDAILCNVNVFTTGFDEPSVETIILNRATMSLNLYLQMVGRGARIYENKEHFKVLDLGLNTERFGFYEDNYNWKSYFEQGKMSKGDGVAPVKECPKCKSMLHARVTICPECGHDFVEEREVQEKEERVKKLVELKRERPYKIEVDSLINYAKNKSYNPYQVLHKLSDSLALYYDDFNEITNFYEVCEKAKEPVKKWCNEYGKNYNSHFNLIKKMIKEKYDKRKQNTE